MTMIRQTDAGNETARCMSADELDAVVGGKNSVVDSAVLAILDVAIGVLKVTDTVLKMI